MGRTEGPSLQPDVPLTIRDLPLATHLYTFLQDKIRLMGSTTITTLQTATVYGVPLKLSVSSLGLLLNYRVSVYIRAAVAVLEGSP